MSENPESGKSYYGNDVYLIENRKNAKIKFPIECTSKMCQVCRLKRMSKTIYLKIILLNIKHIFLVAEYSQYGSD